MMVEWNVVNTYLFAGFLSSLVALGIYYFFFMDRK